MTSKAEAGKPPAAGTTPANGRRTEPLIEPLAGGEVPRPELAPWDPELAEALGKLLHAEDAATRDLDRELEKLAGRYRDATYSELIYLLSHLRFEPAEAREHWRRIVEQRARMSERLGAPVDPRVALISYFLHVHRKLENPTIIEMKLFERARELAYRDELTGLRNYRYFSECVQHEISRCQQYNSSVSLVMADIDDFKLYNDRNGHVAGNRALAAIARLLLETSRKTDVVARYGGEEFAMVLPATPKLGAMELAERTRRRIEDHLFEGAGSQPEGRLTLSLGIAVHPGDAAEPEELVRRADSALYLAKSRGKNQVQLFGSSRRDFQRVPAVLEGIVRFGKWESPCTTVDVSEGGARFRAELSLPVGALVDLTITLPEPRRRLRLAGRVVQSRRVEAGGYEAAVRTLDLTAPERKALADFLAASTAAAGDRSP